MSENTDTFSAHEVATWLRRHPTFLKQFPDLAVSLLVPRDDGPTASLATYQLEVLRDKNRELSRRLHELGHNAQDNERLAVRTHQLTLALMRQTSAADTLKAMAASLAEDFNGELVRLVLLAGRRPGGRLAADHRRRRCTACPVPRLPERRRANLRPPAGGKHALLYADQAANVQSTALLPLPGIGLIAVGSSDANRFYPGMGTLFLRMMGESLGVALQRFDT